MNNLEEIRRELKKKGISKVDIEMAFNVALRISVLDEMVFPEEEETCRITFIYALRNSYDFCTVYDRGRDLYLIFVNGIDEFVRKVKNAEQPIITEKDGKVTLKALRLTWKEIFMMVAVHEIRHRLQKKFPISKFSPKSSRYVKDRTLKELIDFLKFESEEQKKRYIRKGKSQTFIRRFFNRIEFDAKVVEYLVLSKIHRRRGGFSWEEIPALIKIERPR